MSDRATKCRSSGNPKSNSISKALNHLRMTKEKGIKNELIVEEQKPLYYEMEEHEYNQLVAERSRKKFVEDDDGLGYDDFGEEVFDVPSVKNNRDNHNKHSNTKKKGLSIFDNNDNGGKKFNLVKEKGDANAKFLSPSGRITELLLGKHDSGRMELNAKRSKFLGESGEFPDENSNDDIISLENLLDNVDSRKEPRKSEEKNKVIFVDPKPDGVCNSAEDAVQNNLVLNGVQMDENLEEWELFKEAERQSRFDAFFTSEKTEFLPNGDLLVYWFDVYEDHYAAPGSVFLFGHLYDGKYHSRCVTPKGLSTYRSSSIAIRVNNIRRVVYVVPREGADLEEVRQEIEVLGRGLGIPREQIWTKRVRKNYSFQLKNVPDGESDYLEVCYPFNYQEFGSDVSGRTFYHVIGSTRTALELFILNLQIWGPCWLLVKNYKKTNSSFSWCKFDCVVEEIEDLEVARFSGTISVDSKGMVRENKPNTTISYPLTPQLTVLSLNVKTLINQTNKQNEIFSVTLWLSKPISIDTSHVFSEEDEKFSKVFIRRLPGMRSITMKNSLIEFCASETALLNGVVSLIKLWDPDILVGYGFLNLDLEIMIHRLQICKVDYWSRLGRLRWNKIPKSKTPYDNESRWRCRQVTAGRLLCDLQEMVSEFEASTKSFKFDALASHYYPEVTRRDVDVADLILAAYSTHVEGPILEEKFANFALSTKLDSMLVFRLVIRIDALSLTYQLTLLAGNTWSNSLMGARAERIDFLLLHKFTSMNYIVPDRVRQKMDFKKKLDPTYKGGLVLEPKVGFYDTIVLLLDFNSLYPSIIQEYNICFTTVERVMDSNGEWVEAKPLANVSNRGILSESIAQLIKKRKEIKDQINRESDPIKKKQLEIRQLAVKLVANSMYGCLGFKNSRFYALPLAELITRKGRESLTKAQEIVVSKGIDIIYGDTDSLMINTHLLEYEEAYKLGLKLLNDINCVFSKMTIGIDGLFKKLLLLKKKKYAALQFISKSELRILKKGLDLVRRDWCKLCREVGCNILEKIFLSKDQDMVESIHEYLRDVSASIRSGKFSIDNFIIYKTLKKNPEKYSDGKNLPHVKVAFDLKNQKKPVFIGETIEYIICKVDNGESSLAAKAFSPDDIIKDRIPIDYEWYLSNQVFPSVSRICEFLEGADSYAIANCLEIDLKSFKSCCPSKTNKSVLLFLEADGCKNYEDWELVCPSCKTSNVFLGIEKKFNIQNFDNVNELKGEFYSSLRCKSCLKQYPCNWLLNNLTHFIQTLARKYYSSSFICNEVECGNFKDFHLAFKNGIALCTSTECNGTMKLVYDQVKLYNQLMYLDQITNLDKLFRRLEPNLKMKIEDIIKSSPTEYHLLNRINSIVVTALSQNKYSMVDLGSIFLYSPKNFC